MQLSIKLCSKFWSFLPEIRISYCIKTLIPLITHYDIVKEESLDLILEQYRRCCEDWRHYDRLLWQIPFSTFVATGTILTLIYKFVEELAVRRVLILDLMVFILSMSILAIKVRFFQNVRTVFAKNIEKRYELRILPVETNDALDYVKEMRIWEETKKNVLLNSLETFIYKHFRAYYIQVVTYLMLILTLLYLFSQL